MRVRHLKSVGLAALLLVLLAGHPAVAPYHQPGGGEEGGDEGGDAQTITITLGNFFFEGPQGRSSSAENPRVVARLENGKAYKLVFRNTSGIPHQVVSPLFNDQRMNDGTLGRDDVRSVSPGQTLEIEITPNFLTVADGQRLAFDLSCHVGHGSAGDHFKQGMHGLIEIAPSS